MSRPRAERPGPGARPTRSAGGGPRGLKGLRRRAVYLAVRTLAAAFAPLPPPVALALGAAGGWVAHLLDRGGFRRASSQLAWALGLGAPAARALARRVYANVGRVAAETALGPRLGLAEYVALSPAALQTLRDALALGRGVVFVSAHLGSFELLAQRIAAEGLDCVTLARGSSNPWLGAWMVGRRARAGVETINRGAPGAARQLLGALRRGAVLGVLIDQDTKVESVHVPFFGRPAATPTVAAALALRRGAPLVAGFIRRRGDGRGHEVELARVPLEAEGAGAGDEAPRAGRAAGPAADRSAAIAALTARLTAVIEAAVRARPDEWVWFHARWRR